MFVVLLVIGLLLTAVGLVTVGFGMPIDALNLGTFGNALVTAGATLVAGGLVLVGLAMVVRQLQRVAAALATQPARQPAKPVEVPVPMVPPTARMSGSPAATSSSAKPSEPAPSRPSEPRSFEPRAPEPRLFESRASEPRAVEPRDSEPRFSEPRSSEQRPSESRPSEPRRPASQMSDAPPPPVQSRAPLSWLRSTPRKPPSDQPPVTEIKPEAPLRDGLGLPQEAAEPKARAPSRDDDGTTALAEPPAEPRIERSVRPTPASERGKDSGLFDVSWPSSKSGPAAPDESDKREQPRNILSRARQGMPPEQRTPPPAPERTSAILKSGVIDGMAYTLYADGSIEAELPQGTLTFASVDALRAHLEKHGG